MCNLYRVKKSVAEIADLFRVEAASGGNVPEEIYPGMPGWVVAGGQLRSMAWGFPFSQRGAKGQMLKPRPVNNARTDKLDSFFWRYSFEERRCIIPVSAFAEAQGPKGAMTRTWISVPGEDPFAIAGIWRDSEEWGPVYAMVMTEANEQIRAIHSRMPVILRPDDHRQWVEGSAGDARALCRPAEFPLYIDATSERWARG